MAWTSAGQDGSAFGVFGQRYDSAGRTVGTEFRINSYTTSSQADPSVASDANGNFVVVWESDDQDGLYNGIFGQRYDSSGAALGGEFQVNSYWWDWQSAPSVASSASGNFVVVWESYRQDGDYFGVFGQRYDSAGRTAGAEFLVNTQTGDDQGRPSVASDASGNFVVVWESYDFFDEDWSIFAQRYDSDGEPLGGEFRVNSYTTDRQRYASVASDASGNFVVVWESEFGQDGSDEGIFGQRYDSQGRPRGGEFQVNSYTTGAQEAPSVAADPSGNFVVYWHGAGKGDASYGIFAKRYDSRGVAVGDEFRVNSYTTNWQLRATAAAAGVNRFVVAWTSGGHGPDQDGDGYGVFGRRYNFASGTITVVKPNTNVRWVIGSVKEIAWTHDLGVNATFRIELDRNDDGTFEELIAADAPADSATTGSFAWTVTGPPTSRARVRVSWTDDLAVSDVSGTTFRIKLEG